MYIAWTSFRNEVSVKYRLWVLVRTASTLCFEQKQEKQQNFLIKFSFFTTEKKNQ